MREFWVRLVSMLAIVGVLLGYNSVLDVRAKEDEIARLSAQVDQIATTYKVAGKPVNTWVPGIMSGIKRNEFSEYRIPDRKQSYL